MDQHSSSEPGWVAALIGVLSFVSTGAILLLKAAFRVGATETARAQEVARLARLETACEELKAQQQSIMMSLARAEHRLNSIERSSKPDMGE